MSKQIEHGLALAIAGQVSAGLTRGDNELDRARACLQAIGLFMLTATDREQLIVDTLALSDHTVATVSGDGLSISYTPPPE